MPADDFGFNLTIDRDPFHTSKVLEIRPLRHQPSQGNLLASATFAIAACCIEGIMK
jgi:hypothetical protein